MSATNSTERLVAYHGTTHINSADGATTGEWFGFVVLETTVFTTCTDQNDDNLRDDMNIGGGKSLEPGLYKIGLARANQEGNQVQIHISNIELTSGSINSLNMKPLYILFRAYRIFLV